MYESVDSELTAALTRKVRALCSPETFPEPTGDVESIETHMAWVFLTDRHAYKIKKPVRTAFFDHTTIGARRRACRRELQLNRRLAPQVYLEVVPLVPTEAGHRIGAGGEPDDWLVKMKRLPRRCTLENRIESGDIAPDEVDAVTDRLSRFYEGAEPAGFDGPDYRARLEEDIEAKCITLAKPRYGQREETVEAVEEALIAHLAGHRRQFDARACRVVDAHGDLRAEHVFVIDPDPVVIDCLEFKQSLRLLDPVSELSFLALECDRLGAPWAGERLLTGYAHRTDDEVPEQLVPFYKAYHAVVRATVAVWHIDDEVLDESEKWRRKGREYLRMARQLL